MSTPTSTERFEASFIIRTNEINLNRQITVAALLTLMQETALRHVMKLKASNWDMEEEKVSWVLIKKRFHSMNLPSLGENITIHTYIAGINRLFAYRDYKVYNEAGELVATSSSIWILMNTASRKAARIPQDIIESNKGTKEEALPPPPSKIKELTAVDFEKNFIVNWHDLDFNKHLSNLRYHQWIFETVDFYVNERGRLTQLDIQFKSECTWKQEIIVQTQKLQNNTYLHKIFNQTTQETVAIAQTVWKEN